MSTSLSPYFKKIFLPLLLFFLYGCKPSPYTNNVIATAHPLATAAGEAMYAQGGTAADAAVAAGFTLAVVEPSMSGIGGRLQALYRTPEGVISGIDASTEVPAAYVAPEERYAFGYETIGIPGVVAGLLALHEAEGKLSLEAVMAPAIRHATEGFELLPGEALRQQMALEQFLQFEGTQMYFSKPDSTAFQAGERLVQKDLAATLSRIATQGHKGFYEGETAQKIVADLQAQGSILTLEDLKNYKARSSKVLTGTYRGHTIHALYLPSFGAITIQILQLLDQLAPIEKGNPKWPELLGHVTKKAYAYRRYQTNTDSLQKILSTEAATKMMASTQMHATLAFADTNTWPESWKAPMGHTTHLTTADESGRVVALTQTIGPNMGSKVATPGLGFLYAVTLGGYLGNLQPGDRAPSHISPTFISKNGRVRLALGAAGGSRIVTAVTQVTQRFFDQNLSLAKALEAPRIYPDADTLLIENHIGISWDSLTLKRLKAKAIPFKLLTQQGRFGRVHAIALDTLHGAWIGAADPDWEGTVAEFKEEN